MEELKNNETSEKKETIEPLEVITLEGDENQVAEEKMDSPVIRRGDIYRIEEDEWRVDASIIIGQVKHLEFDLIRNQSH